VVPTPSPRKVLRHPEPLSPPPKKPTGPPPLPPVPVVPLSPPAGEVAHWSTYTSFQRIGPVTPLKCLFFPNLVHRDPGSARVLGGAPGVSVGVVEREEGGPRDARWTEADGAVRRRRRARTRIPPQDLPGAPGVRPDPKILRLKIREPGFLIPFPSRKKNLPAGSKAAWTTWTAGTTATA